MAYAKSGIATRNGSDLHSIHERLKEMTVLIALGEQSRILGTIGFKPVSDVEGHIRGMAVHPEWQGRGVAWRLLEEAQKELRKLGCYRVTLGTTKPLEQAMTFYERNGFRRSGKVGDFFGMPLIEYVKNLEDS